MHAILIAEFPRETRFGHSSTVLSAVLSARDSLYHKKLQRQDNQSVVVHPLKMGNRGRVTCLNYIGSLWWDLGSPEVLSITTCFYLFAAILLVLGQRDSLLSGLHLQMLCDLLFL